MSTRHATNLKRAAREYQEQHPGTSYTQARAAVLAAMADPAAAPPASPDRPQIPSSESTTTCVRTTTDPGLFATQVTWTTVCVNPAHLTAAEWHSLRAGTRPTGAASLVDRSPIYGTRVMVRIGGGPRTAAATDDSFGAMYWPTLIPLMRYLADRGADWVYLDEDATVIPGYPLADQGPSAAGAVTDVTNQGEPDAGEPGSEIADDSAGLPWVYLVRDHHDGAYLTWQAMNAVEDEILSEDCDPRNLAEDLAIPAGEYYLGKRDLDDDAPWPVVDSDGHPVAAAYTEEDAVAFIHALAGEPPAHPTPQDEAASLLSDDTGSPITKIVGTMNGSWNAYVTFDVHRADGGTTLIDDSADETFQRLADMFNAIPEGAVTVTDGEYSCNVETLRFWVPRR